MNMLGVALASKALNNMSKGSGRGGHYYGGSELSEEEEFLINCKEIIESCSNMPGNEGSFIPVTTEHKRTLKQKIRGEKNEDTREIFIAKIKNKNGNNPEFEGYNGLVKVIGMIDDDKIFEYEEYGRSTKLSVMTFEEHTNSKKVGNIMTDGYSSTDNDVHMSTTTVYGKSRVEVTGNTLNKKYGRGFDKYINLALKMKELRDKAKAKEEAANSAEEIEME
ncbi:MAG: hypothetical protein IKJ33_03045 [Clostridia bacterium]|nr:hypothetical protein [Clostridia bacterium]